MEVIDLVQGYEFHRPSYLRCQYNETELQQKMRPAEGELAQDGSKP